MTEHNIETSLRQMLDHAREAVEMAQGKTRDDFETNRMLNLALVRLIEIIGEAAGRIPRETQKLHPQIPWPQIIGMRNRLIHAYDQIDYDILWNIVADDLPLLVSELQGIIKNF
jgi:uncharacterized protein with HEPN domain